MPHLETLAISNAEWLSTDNVQDILGFCPELKSVAFRDSGSFKDDPKFTKKGIPRRNHRDVFWAAMGTVDEIAEILVAELGP